MRNEGKKQLPMVLDAACVRLGFGPRSNWGSLESTSGVVLLGYKPGPINSSICESDWVPNGSLALDGELTVFYFTFTFTFLKAPWHGLVLGVAAFASL